MFSISDFISADLGKAFRAPYPHSEEETSTKENVGKLYTRFHNRLAMRGSQLPHSVSCQPMLHNQNRNHFLRIHIKSLKKQSQL